MEDFGTRLNYLRKQKGLSLEKMGILFNITKNATSSWETGKSKPNADDLVKLAELLGTTPNYLLLGSEDKREMDNLREANALKDQIIEAQRATIEALKYSEHLKNIEMVSV